MVSWLIAGCAGGFATSLVFAGVLKLSRNIFLIPYVTYCIILLYTFIRTNDINVAAIFEKNWVWGVFAGAVTSVFLIRNVRSQPATRQSSGAGLILDISWAGLVYGSMDALLLNIFPVVAIAIGMSQFGWTATLPGKVGVGAIGLLASLLITVIYHIGYPEFRGNQMRLAIVGNTIITLAFLLSGNPLGSLISHSVMHVAAVLQGAETTIQLPPHYQGAFKQG
jgi:hypothetical protein